MTSLDIWRSDCTFGIDKVQDVIILQEQVHFLDRWNRTDAQALQGVLKAFVIRRASSVVDLFLPASHTQSDISPARCAQSDSGDHVPSNRAFTSEPHRVRNAPQSFRVHLRLTYRSRSTVTTALRLVRADARE